MLRIWREYWPLVFWIGFPIFVFVAQAYDGWGIFTFGPPPYPLPH